MSKKKKQQMKDYYDINSNCMFKPYPPSHE